MNMFFALTLREYQKVYQPSIYNDNDNSHYNEQDSKRPPNGRRDWGSFNIFFFFTYL